MTSVERFSEQDLREMVIRLAHEIRNPLATIQTSVQLIQHLSRPTGEEAEYLGYILNEVGRIDKTIRDMQKYVRLESPRPERAPIGDAVAEAVRNCQEDASAAGLRIEVTGNEGDRARIDGEHLRMALAELLSNAIRFSAPKSVVTVSWREAGAGQMGIHFEDGCPGISPELAPRILKPFFSSSTQGTGLGLSIVSRVCDMAEGRLEWRNLPGGGCRFSLILPGGADGA